MKAIMLFEGTMVIRELRRMVHRNNDIIIVDLAIEPRYGTVLSEDLYRKQRVLALQVTKEHYPSLWASLKDATNDELIIRVGEMLNESLPVISDYKNEEDNPTFRMAIQETLADGSTKFWYEDDYEDLDEGATNEYEEAMARTGHSPVSVRQSNSHESALRTLQGTYPLNEFSSGLDYLLSIDVTAPLSVEDIG